MATVVEPDVATYQQYIDGEWTGAEDGRTYEVINPSTEEVMALAPASTRADAKRAVAAARRSFEAGEWRLKSQLQRTQIMFQIVEHLQEVSEDWGLLESQNAGAALRKTVGGGRAARHRVVPQHGRAGAEHPLVRAAALDRFAIRVLELRAARADRRVRRDHPVELPAHLRDVEDRAGARDGQLDRAQAVAADTALVRSRLRARSTRPGCCLAACSTW